LNLPTPWSNQIENGFQMELDQNGYSKRPFNEITNSIKWDAAIAYAQPNLAT